MQQLHEWREMSYVPLLTQQEAFGGSLSTNLPSIRVPGEERGVIRTPKLNLPNFGGKCENVKIGANLPKDLSVGLSFIYVICN